MLKGPFWVAEEEILSYPVEISTQPTPSHRDVWKYASGVHRRKPWDYFPRGRIEIRNQKVIIFANPDCLLYENFESKIRSKFKLGDAIIILKADNSKHYQYRYLCF